MHRDHTAARWRTRPGRLTLIARGAVGALALTLAGMIMAPASGAQAETAAQSRTHIFGALPVARDLTDSKLNALSPSDLRSTGYYLPADEPLKITVSSLSADASIMIGAPDAAPEEEYRAPREYPLHTGSNTVTDPGGGVIYYKVIGEEGFIRSTLGKEAQPMPYFTLGETSELAFQQQLEDRKTPYVELSSAHSMITVERASALKFRNEDHSALMRTFEDIIAIEDKISGYDGTRPLHDRLPHPYHFVGFPGGIDGVGAYATHGHMSFPSPIQDRLLTVEGLRLRGWSINHELGHQHQQTAYKPSSLTEVTVNIYSLAVNASFAKTYGQLPRLHSPDAKTGLTPWESAIPKIGSTDVDFLTTFDPYEKLVMFEQMRLAFGDDYWPTLHRLVREDHPEAGEYTDEALRLRNLVVWSSKAAGYDLSDFFVKWGVPVDAEATEQIAALELEDPPVDPTTLRDDTGNSLARTIRADPELMARNTI